MEKYYDHLSIEKRHSRLQVADHSADAAVMLLPVPGCPIIPGDVVLLLIYADIFMCRHRMQGQTLEWRGTTGLAAAVSRLPSLGLMTGIWSGTISQGGGHQPQRLFVALHRRGYIHCRTSSAGRIWMLHTAELAASVFDDIERRDAFVIPDSWRKSCLQWLRQVREWRISRCPGPGPAVPAWLCAACGALQVAETSPAPCRCGSHRWQRVPETLDAKFVTARQLLPPAPAALLVASAGAVATASAAIMFARFVGVGFPFRETLAVGRLRAGRRVEGRRIRGAIITAHRSYGADALRAALVSSAVAGRDVQLTPGRLKGARRLAGKIWNAVRFVLLHLRGDEAGQPDLVATGDAALWALHRLNIVSERVNEGLDGHRLQEAMALLDHFVRHDLCDWYLEMSTCDLENRAARQALREILLAALRLLHPFLPFVTQELYDRLGAGRVANTSFPVFDKQLVFPEAYVRIERLRRLVRLTRRLRSSNGIAPGLWVEPVLWARDSREQETAATTLRYYDALCRCRNTTIVTAAVHLPPGFRAVMPGWEVRLPFADESERGRAVSRLQTEAALLDSEIVRLQRQLVAARLSTARLQERKRCLQQVISRRQFIGASLADIS